MILISRKIGDIQTTFVYNPKFDGPLEVYKRNPSYTVNDSSTDNLTLESLEKMLKEIFDKADKDRLLGDNTIEIFTEGDHYFAVRMGTIYTGKGGLKLYMDNGGPLYNVKLNGKSIEGKELEEFIQKTYPDNEQIPVQTLQEDSRQGFTESMD